jgi:uncharacterized protein YggE
MEIPEKNKKRILQALYTLLIILSAYFAVKIFSEIKKDSMLGESAAPATISFSGHGEVTAVPDIANVYFTISKDASTVKDAQAGVAAVEKKALDVLKGKGIEDKDIKTADASFNPKYEYKQEICPQGSSYCGNGNQVIVGYTASESITVKIRKTDDSGAIMQELGAVGVSNLSGPNFAIDNEDGLKAQARKIAIDDAKTKAGALADDLGVSLGKIASFSENGNTPIMYAAKAMTLDSVAAAPAPAQLPKGENTITSDVTITYEIK